MFLWIVTKIGKLILLNQVTQIHKGCGKKSVGAHTERLPLQCLLSRELKHWDTHAGNIMSLYILFHDLAHARQTLNTHRVVLFLRYQPNPNPKSQDFGWRVKSLQPPKTHLYSIRIKLLFNWQLLAASPCFLLIFSIWLVKSPNIDSLNHLRRFCSTFSTSLWMIVNHIFTIVWLNDHISPDFFYMFNDCLVKSTYITQYWLIEAPFEPPTITTLIPWRSVFWQCARELVNSYSIAMENHHF